MQPSINRSHGVGLRCEKFGIACDGYPALSPKTQKPARIVARRTPPVISSDIYPSMLTSFFNDAIEKHYFDFWKLTTPPDAGALLDSTIWARLMLQSCDIPSIRYGIFAVGALELALLEAEANAAVSPDIKVKDVTNIHHRTAIKYFDKALKHMRADSEKQSIRTILLTCLLNYWFECFHGNYLSAVAQLRIGSELLYEWIESLPPNSTSTTHFPSPEPSIVEDELVQAFNYLAIPNFHNADPSSPQRRTALQCEYTEVVRLMPGSFVSLEKARQYLEIIVQSSHHLILPVHSDAAASPTHLHKKIGNEFFRHVIEGLATATTAASSQDPPMLVLQDPTREDSIAEFHVDEVKREELLGRLRQWYQAFQKSPGYRDLHGSGQWLLLQLHYKTCVLAVNSLSLNSMAYDQYRQSMCEIVDLSSQVLDEFERLGVNKAFIPDVGVILSLYFVGVNCRFPAIRARIIDLLLRKSRREGVWDSILAGRVIQWVRDKEEMFLEGEGDDRTVSWWARLEFVTMDFNLEGRKAKVTCYQRNGPEDPVRRKREAVLKW
jgi:hypothetical protein